MIIYEAIFFDKETVELIHSLEEKPLPILSEDVHCTFKFRPKKNEIFNDLVGKEIEVTLTGYASDGMNSGFKLQLPEDIMKYYINYDEKNPTKLKVPHITTSLGIGATPMNTKDLKFKDLPKKYKIKGKFGFWVSTGYRTGKISYKKDGK